MFCDLCVAQVITFATVNVETYLKKGDDWEKAPVVYQVTVLDFKYGNEAAGSSDILAKAPVSRYAMRTKDGRELSNSLNVIFIELPKAPGLEDSIDTNSSLENWAIFLKEADNPKKKDVIEKLTKKEAGLMQAQKSLSSISADQDLWIAQYRRSWRKETIFQVLLLSAGKECEKQ